MMRTRFAEGGLASAAIGEDEDYLTTIANAEGLDDGYESPDEVGQISGLGPSGIMDKALNPGVSTAQSHLQEVIASLVKRQELMQSSNTNWTPAAKLALAAGLLSPTRSGGFGESIGNAAGQMAPVIAKQDSERRSAADKLDQLRLMGAKLEVDSESNQAKMIQAKALADQRRLDSLAKVGLTVDPETGKYVLDESLMKAQAARAGAIAEAQAAARAKHSPTTGEEPLADTPLTDEEIKQWGFRPGTVAVMTKKGPKVLQAPTATQMVFSGKYDEKGDKVFEPADTTLTPQIKKQYVSTIETGKKILPHLNYLIDQVESGKIGAEAFGTLANMSEIGNVTVGQLTGKQMNDKGVEFRQEMGLLNEADIKKYFSRDPSKPSNKEAEDIETLLPSTGWFESKGRALSRMKKLRERVMSNMRDAGTSIGEEGIDDIVNEYGQRIKRTEMKPPSSKKATKSNVTFPMTVRKGNQVATVSSKEELDEATAEGFAP